MQESELSKCKLQFEQSEDDLKQIRSAVRRARKRMQAKLARKR